MSADGNVYLVSIEEWYVADWAKAILSGSRCWCHCWAIIVNCHKPPIRQMPYERLERSPGGIRIARTSASTISGSHGTRSRATCASGGCGGRRGGGRRLSVVSDLHGGGAPLLLSHLAVCCCEQKKWGHLSSRQAMLTGAAWMCNIVVACNGYCITVLSVAKTVF